MSKNLSAPFLEKFFPVIGKVLYSIALLLTFVFLLFDANQKNNYEKVKLNYSMELGDFILNINEKMSLTAEENLARMLSLKNVLQAVDNEALLEDGLILSRDILLMSGSPGNYRIKILLNNFTSKTSRDIRNRYINALKKFYKAYDLQISSIAGVAG